MLILADVFAVVAYRRHADFRALLREAVPDTVSDDRLDELLDPAGYTGEAGALVDRILAAHAELIDT